MELLFLFYFLPNLFGSLKIVMYKLASVSFPSNRNDQESQKSSETCEIITAKRNTSSFERENQNLNIINLPLVKFPATWFMAVPMFLAVLNTSWVLLEEVRLLVITNQINRSFHRSLFSILVGNNLITLKTVTYCLGDQQVTWMLLGCTICLILSPFSQPHCPLPVLLNHLDIALDTLMLGSP